MTPMTLTLFPASKCQRQIFGDVEVIGMKGDIRRSEYFMLTGALPFPYSPFPGVTIDRLRLVDSNA